MESDDSTARHFLSSAFDGRARPDAYLDGCRSRAVCCDQ
uniref:Uncharacterized protein n=1 Tax=Myoviridae sp. ctu2j3 TaxID=2825197 RepID=A0A8S5UHV3_9CAUD|nr:MAG TPA: hypothetical protein [Myoviridae sp. ctu2j3]DAF94069.1 MAG TPA: hypothetical protein [Myoviridae sp. ctu2j3]